MKEKAHFIPPKKIICNEESPNTNDIGNKKNESIKKSELYKKTFINFSYFNKYSDKNNK